MRESGPKTEQLELFEKGQSLAGAEVGEKRKRKLRLPSARGYNIFGGFAEKIIRETKNEHTCRICGRVIPPGSPAKEIFEVVNGKLLVHSKEYAHLKGQCPPPEQSK
jgi:hypothetical protein